MDKETAVFLARLETSLHNTEASAARIEAVLSEHIKLSNQRHELLLKSVEQVRGKVYGVYIAAGAIVAVIGGLASWLK